jgi:hypothetical protein
VGFLTVPGLFETLGGRANAFHARGDWAFHQWVYFKPSIRGGCHCEPGSVQQQSCERHTYVFSYSFGAFGPGEVTGSFSGNGPVTDVPALAISALALMVRRSQGLFTPMD